MKIHVHKYSLIVWGIQDGPRYTCQNLPKVINFITVLGLLKKTLLDVGALPVSNILCVRVCVNVLIHPVPVCKVYYGIFYVHGIM